MSPSPARRGLGPGPGATYRTDSSTPWFTPGAPAGGDGGSSADQAQAALSRLRLVPVQAAVLETALATARAVLDGQAGQPAVREAARVLTGILDRLLTPSDNGVPAGPAPLRSVPAPTVTGTGSAALG